MISTRICKIHRRIPLCTPHQGQECAGIGLTSLAVTYTAMVCKYLTHALNNRGSLGFTTRAMLTLQNSVIDETLQHGPSKRYLRQTSHYHVARQLAVLQSSGLQLGLPMGHEDLHGNALHRMMTCVRYDPHDLGFECKIPAGVYKPLLDLCTDFHELCLPNRRKLTILSTTELAQKFGKAVNSKHKLALNQVTQDNQQESPLRGRHQSPQLQPHCTPEPTRQNCPQPTDTNGAQVPEREREITML